MMIRRYTPSDAKAWDAFVDASANGTFLHRREYMDYHADRFADCSLMAFNGKGVLVAVLPACVEGDTLYSHSGLTYGGWLNSPRHFDASQSGELWTDFIEWMRDEGIARLVYKPVPHIYCRYPADDHLYWLWRHGASESACQLSTAIPLHAPSLVRYNVRREVDRALQSGVTVSRVDDPSLFWPILENRLASRHDVRPTHTLAEMQLLMERFPDEILLYMAFSPDGKPLAGVVLYVTPTCVHTQYMATTTEGQRASALGCIIQRICQEYGSDSQSRVLDFGTSCEEGGAVLNVGLYSQKYGLGGRPVVYPTFTLTIPDSQAESQHTLPER